MTMIKKVCLRNSNKPLTPTTIKMRMEEGRQCYSGIMLVKGKLVNCQIVMVMKLGHQQKKKLTSTVSSPMILAICTPIMRRAHQYVQQSIDVVFVDATSSFDRQNISIFLLSTVTPGEAVPLGVFVTSDEQEETITEGLRSLSSNLPDNAFFGEGPQIGPSLVMTDDGSAERNALTTIWKSATPFLCTFHFLQHRWTWLHDSKNGVRIKEHRIILIKAVKGSVYAEEEDKLEELYLKIKHLEVAKCYPQFLSHMELLWPRKKEWADCYRIRILL